MMTLILACGFAFCGTVLVFGLIAVMDKNEQTKGK